MPEMKLGGEIEPENMPMVPPRNVENAPRYDPRIVPIIGAIMAAAVTVWPGKPIIGEILRKPKIT